MADAQRDRISVRGGGPPVGRRLHRFAEMTTLSGADLRRCAHSRGGRGGRHDGGLARDGQRRVGDVPGGGGGARMDDGQPAARALLRGRARARRLSVDAVRGARREIAHSKSRQGVDVPCAGVLVGVINLTKHSTNHCKQHSKNNSFKHCRHTTEKKLHSKP